MSAENTILEAAQRALRLIGRPASVEDIYCVVIENDFYSFNTPTPEHVLRTAIRRHTKGLCRVDSSEGRRTCPKLLRRNPLLRV